MARMTCRCGREFTPLSERDRLCTFCRQAMGRKGFVTKIRRHGLARIARR